MFSYDDLPMGFGMALMKNPQAYKIFANMTDAQQQSIISGTHAISSKQEMQEYVNNIAQQS